MSRVPASFTEDRRRWMAGNALIVARIGAAVHTEWGPNTDWCGVATFPDGTEVSVTHARTMADAVEGLAAMLCENAICNHCSRVMALAGLHDALAVPELAGERCRWTRRGAAWCSPHED